MANYGSKRRGSGKKIGLQFPFWEEKMEQLNKLSHFGVLEGSKAALEEAHKIITRNADAAIKPHRMTGATEGSLVRNSEIEVAGNILSAGVGFDIDRGGLPSVFLMHGTPRITPDKKLYNAIYGKATSDEIQSAQYWAVQNVINKYMADK